MKKCAVIHRVTSVVAVFDAYSDPGDLLDRASDLARSRRVDLEAIAVVSPLCAWFMTIGRGMAPVSAPPVSREAEEDAVVRTVARLVGSAPTDVSVRWRIFHGTRRRAMREARGQVPSLSQAEVDALVLPVQA